jgi:type IV pilus assembly protein PilB
MRSPDDPRHLSRRKIGEILVSEGKISDEQLKEALEVQKSDGRNLGKILVSLGHVTPDDLARALSVCLNLEYVNLSEVDVDQEVLGMVIIVLVIILLRLID